MHIIKRFINTDINSRITNDKFLIEVKANVKYSSQQLTLTFRSTDQFNTAEKQIHDTRNLLLEKI